MDDMSREFWGHCGDCGHVWIIAYLPMEIERFARIAMHAYCPKCGVEPKRVYCGRRQKED